MSGTRSFTKWGATVGAFGLGAAFLASSPVMAQDRTYRGERGDGNGGYGQNGQGQNRPNAVTRQPNGNLEARLETDRTQYSGNRAVEITVSLTNVGRADTNIMVPGRGLIYEITVRDGRSNRPVYTADSRRNAGANRGLRLAANENRAWRELWDGRDNSGERVPSGTYVVEARIAGQRAISTQIYLGEGGRPGRPWDGDGNGGNGGSGGNPERPDWPTRPPINGGSGEIRTLRATLTASRTTVRPGDSVRLTYTVQNAGGRNVNLRFTSGRQFDVRAVGPNGRQVWLDSDGKFTTQALQDITIRPGADRIFTTTWTVPRGAASGRYALEAFLTPQQSGGGSTRAVAADMTLRVVGGNASNDDWNDRDDRSNGRDGYPEGNGDGRYGGYDDYQNRRNRVPPGVISGGGLGGPSIFYGSRTGAVLVSPRILTSTNGAQYIGKKVTVSGRCVSETRAANGTVPTTWTLGGDGALLPVVGIAPTASTGAPVTVTGVLRQKPDGSVYLSVP